MTIHAMLAQAAVRRQIELLMAETVAVGRTVGITEPVDIEARMHHATRLADVKTSMLQGFKTGRDLAFLAPCSNSPAGLSLRCRVSRAEQP